MAVSENYRAFILEQLARVIPEVRGRSMFGGVGVYSATTFFALMDNDAVYFKVDDTNRPDYEKLRMPPFRPFGEGGEAMQYYEVPADVIEDLDALRTWADKALSVARRAKARKAKKSR